MQGIIKWFSEAEGLGIIHTDKGAFCFSLADFNGVLQQGQAVCFEATSKKVSIHDQLMQLALNITQLE